MHACMHVCIIMRVYHTCVCKQVCMYVCFYIRIYVRMHVLIYACTHNVPSIPSGALRRAGPDIHQLSHPPPPPAASYMSPPLGLPYFSLHTVDLLRS